MYSPIDNIVIKNFRNLGLLKLSFKESPIICLIGENEAGKTSVIKAVAVCALHAYPKEQKGYIRDNTQMFGVAIELQDGSKIVRIKTDTCNKYEVTRPDGSKWDTTKISEGLPVEVQNLMGLIEEPETKEFLHIRTYEDKLLFVVTQASVNYKVMYDALKVDQITKAIKFGSDEANTTKSRLNRNEESICTLRNSLSAVKIIDIEPLLDVKTRMTKQLDAVNKLEQAMNIVNTINECKNKLGVLRLIDTFKLSEIDMSIANNLNSVSRTIDDIKNTRVKLDKLNEINSLEEINTSSIEKISSVLDIKNELLIKKAKATKFIELNNLSDVNEYVLNLLERAVAYCNNIKTFKQKQKLFNIDECKEISQSDIDNITKIESVIAIINSNNTIKTQLIDINEKIKEYIEIIKNCGVAFETCPNCGSDIVIDIDKLK